MSFDTTALYRGITPESKFFIDFGDNLFPLLCREGVDDILELNIFLDVDLNYTDEDSILLRCKAFMDSCLSEVLEAILGLQLRYVRATDADGQDIPEVNDYFDGVLELPEACVLKGRLKRIEYAVVVPEA